MITTIHARPHMPLAMRSVGQSNTVICPRCCAPLGLERMTRDRQQLLASHRCPASAVQQPAAAIPFS